MDVDEYINKANQQLVNGKLYSKLNEDPTRKHSDIVNNTIESFFKKELRPTSIAKKTYYKQCQNTTISNFTKNT